MSGSRAEAGAGLWQAKLALFTGEGEVRPLWLPLPA